MNNSYFKEYMRIALRSIRSTLLRTILTIAIIAMGITALVGILTSIDALKQTLNNNFASMGANTFNIRNRGLAIRIGSGGERPKVYEPISYDEAMAFKENFSFPATVSATVIGTRIATLKYGAEKTNPNVTVFGVDAEYLTTSGYELSYGRNFTKQEVIYGTRHTIIGKEIAETLFKNAAEAVNKQIKIGAGMYTVIAVLKEKGSSLGFGGDRIALLPVQNVRQNYGSQDMNFVLEVKADDVEQMNVAIGEATGLFRIIRGVHPGEDSTFEITKSDSLAGVLIESLGFVAIIATFIGLITLLGSAIGLMNIMLVSVTERTREIGLRKALGATSQAILWQFLIESVMICQIGGVVGIFIGILVGNIISMITGGGFIIPWLWMTIGVLLCVITGLIAGLLPALKASRLDPIEALRTE
ncbi:MAG: ABC transporter permease [Flavobacteriales bacterium]|nr:ABC transporter permease [Flavobacteriales bacterium]